jgi:hypothetical protein
MKPNSIGMLLTHTPKCRTYFRRQRFHLLRIYIPCFCGGEVRWCYMVCLLLPCLLLVKKVRFFLYHQHHQHHISFPCVLLGGNLPWLVFHWKLHPIVIEGGICRLLLHLIAPFAVESFLQDICTSVWPLLNMIGFNDPMKNNGIMKKVMLSWLSVLWLWTTKLPLDDVTNPACGPKSIPSKASVNLLHSP